MIYQQELIRHTTQNIFLVDERSCCKKLIWFRESGGVTVRSQRTNDDRRGRYRSFRWWDNVCWNNVKTGSGLTRLSLKNTMEYIERWFKNKVQSSIPWWNYHTKDKVSKKTLFYEQVRVLSSAVVLLQTIFQKMCKKGNGKDNAKSEKCKTLCVKWFNSAQNVSTITLPHHFFKESKTANMELARASGSSVSQHPLLHPLK